MNKPPVIELRSAAKRFRGATGGVHTAVHDLTMTVAPGEFVAVVGPTGCGKSTTLSLVSGLEPPSEGEALVNAQPVQGIPDGVGYMFQTDAVLPWRSVLDNVAAGPRYRGQSKAAARDKARAWVSRVGLAGFEGYYPHQLSGGMRKRVALARALALEPEILFLDEPTSGLDPVSARAFDAMVRVLSESLGLTVFIVTHDLDTLLSIVDRAYLIYDGRVESEGTKDFLINDPISRQLYLGERFKM